MPPLIQPPVLQNPGPTDRPGNPRLVPVPPTIAPTPTPISGQPTGKIPDGHVPVWVHPSLAQDLISHFTGTNHIVPHIMPSSAPFQPKAMPGNIRGPMPPTIQPVPTISPPVIQPADAITQPRATGVTPHPTPDPIVTPPGEVPPRIGLPPMPPTPGPATSNAKPTILPPPSKEPGPPQMLSRGGRVTGDQGWTEPPTLPMPSVVQQPSGNSSLPYQYQGEGPDIPDLNIAGPGLGLGGWHYVYNDQGQATPALGMAPGRGGRGGAPPPGFTPQEWQTFLAAGHANGNWTVENGVPVFHPAGQTSGNVVPYTPGGPTMNPYGGQAGVAPNAPGSNYNTLVQAAMAGVPGAGAALAHMTGQMTANSFTENSVSGASSLLPEDSGYGGGGGMGRRSDVNMMRRMQGQPMGGPGMMRSAALEEGNDPNTTNASTAARALHSGTMALVPHPFSKGGVPSLRMVSKSGRVPGPGKIDTDMVDAKLAPGEIVVNEKQMPALRVVPGLRHLLRRDQIKAIQASKRVQKAA